MINNQKTWEEISAALIAMQAESDALAISNNKLRDALDKVANWSECTAEFRINYGSNGERDFYRGIAQSVLRETPQHHLAAHDAEVAKAAFIAGAMASVDVAYSGRFEIEEDAESYADRIRAKAKQCPTNNNHPLAVCCFFVRVA